MTHHRTREDRRLSREEALRDSVDGIMRDTRYDRLRGRPARRALVVAFVLLLVALLPSYLAWSAIGGTVTMALGVVVLTLLRQATRVVADAPPDLLDERQRALQGRTYLSAYRLVGSVAALAALLAFAVVLFSPDPEAFSLVISIDAVTGVSILVIGLVLAAPTCVYAWEQETT